MAGGKRARGALAMHAQLLLLTVDVVGLHLGDVVRHVVDQVHAELFSRRLEHLGEGLAGQVRHDLPVRPGVVRRRPHRTEIVLTLRRTNRRTCELAIGQFDAVLLRHAAQRLEAVLAHLIAQAARAGVDHDGYPALLEPEYAGRVLIDHLLDHLHFEEVVAAAERAALRAAALKGAVGNEVGPRSVEPPASLGHVQIGIPPVAALDDIAGAVAQQLLHFIVIELHPPAAPHAAGHCVEQRVDQLLHPLLCPLELDIGSDQSHAAVDVVSHTARADHTVGLRISCGDAADAEAVAPMNVRHRQRVAHDAGQHGDICDLVRRLVASDGVDQRVVGINHPVDAHAALVRFRNPPTALVNPLQRPGIRFSHDSPNDARHISTIKTASKPPLISRIASS